MQQPSDSFADVFNTLGSKPPPPEKGPSLIGGFGRDLRRLGSLGTLDNSPAETIAGDMLAAPLAGLTSALQGGTEFVVRGAKAISDQDEDRYSYTLPEQIADRAARLWVEVTTGQKIDDAVYDSTVAAWQNLSEEERETMRDENRDGSFQWLEDNMLSRESRPEILQSKSVAANLTAGLTQVIVPSVGVTRLPAVAQALSVFGRAGKVGVGAKLTDWTIRNAVVGSFVEGVVVQEDEGRLADILPMLPWVGDDLADLALVKWLQTGPDDTYAEGKLKNMVEGALLMPFADTLLTAFGVVAKKGLGGLGITPDMTAEASSARIAELTRDGELSPELATQLGIDWELPQFSKTGVERSRVQEELIAAGRPQEEVDALTALTDNVAAKWAANTGNTVDGFYERFGFRKGDQAEANGENTLYQGPTNQEILDEADPAGAFDLPRGPDGSVKATTSQMASFFDRVSRKRGTTISIGDYSDKATSRTAQRMYDELKYRRAKNGAEGGNWYLEGPAKMFAFYAKNKGWAELSNDENAQQMFLFHVALTSDGANVKPNLKNAALGYEGFRESGKIDIRKIGIASGENDKIAATANKMLQDLGPDKFRQFLEQPFTVAALEAKFGIKVGGEGTGVDVIGAMVFGPKLGAFYGNLSGHSGFLTMDRWWTRTWNRMRGTSRFSDDLKKKKYDKQHSTFAEKLAADKSVKRAKNQLGTREYFESLGLDMDRALVDRDYLFDEVSPALTKVFAKGDPTGRFDKKGKEVYRSFNDNREINKWANNTDKIESQDVYMAPRGAPERRAMRAAAERAVEMIQKDFDPEMTMSKLQAELWFGEKDVAKHLGAPKRSWEKADYTTAAEELLREELGDVFDGNIEGDFRAILDARSGRVGSQPQRSGDASTAGSDLGEPGEARRAVPGKSVRGRSGAGKRAPRKSLKQDARGRIDFHDDGRALISLFESADGSTALHELGHFFRHTLSEVDPELSGKFDSWVGAKPGEAWTVPQEEKFASSLEHYLLTGKSPSPELNSAFETLAGFMRQAYKKMAELASTGRMKIHPKVSLLFDDLFTLPPGRRESMMTPYERSRQAQGQVPPDGSFAVADDAGRAAFAEGTRRTYAEHKFGKAVTVKDAEFYADPANRLFMSPDGSAGVAVTPEGDVVSVFKVPGSKADINSIISEAGAYAKTLDNFDIGGKLPSLYAPHGFRPAGRMKFDIQYAPEGWDVDVYGTPDVVFMVKDTTGASGLPEVKGDYDSIRERVPYFKTWDEAAAARDLSVAKVDAAKRLRNAPSEPEGGLAASLTKTLFQLKGKLKAAGLDNAQLAVSTHTNISKLQTTSDVHAFLSAIDNMTQGRIDNVIGAKQTLDEVRAEAEARGLDHVALASAIEKGAQVTQKLASLIVAGRMLKVSLGERLVKSSEAVLAGKAGAEGELLLAHSALARVDTQLGIITKEAARATGSGRIEVRGLSESQAKAIADSLIAGNESELSLLDAADAATSRGEASLAAALRARAGVDGASKAKKIAQMIVDASAVGQVSAVAKKLREADDPTVIDALLEVYKAALLSGVRTFSINVLSGGVQSYMQATARMLGSGARMGTARGRSDFVASSRYMIQLHGAMFDIASMFVMNGHRKGVYVPDVRKSVGRTIKGETPNIYGTMKQNGGAVSTTESKKAVSAETFGMDSGTAAGKAVDGMGRLIRLPFLVSMLGEEWWSQVNYLAFVRNKALDDAEVKGIWDDVNMTDAEKHVATQDFVQSFTQRSFDEFGSATRKGDGSFSHEDAVRYSKSANFMQDLEHGLGQFLLDGKRKDGVGPMLELVLPFVKAPTNLIRTAARYSVVGDAALRGGRGSAPKLDQWELDKNRGEMMLGGMFMTVAAVLASNGAITGGGPVNPAERTALEASGWRPYSFVRHDADGNKTYTQFNRFDPQASIFGLVADFTEVMPYMESGEVDKAIGKALTGIAQNFASKTYLRGLSDTLKAIQQPDRYGKKYVQGIAASTIPFSSLGRGMNQAMDDESLRETYTFLDQVKLRIPGMSQSLPPRRNILGEPITPTGGYIPFTSGETAVGRMASPAAFSRESSDEAIQEMARLQASFSMPSESIDGVNMTRYSTESGQNAFDRYQELTGTLTLNGKNVSASLNELVSSSFYRSLPEPTGDSRQDIYNPRVKAIKKILDGYRSAARSSLLREIPEIRDEIARRKIGGATGTRRLGTSNGLSRIDELLD